MTTNDSGSDKVDKYIQDSPHDAQKMLQQVRRLLKNLAPNATETLKWGYPVLEEGRILFSYSAHKTHLNFMPTRSSLKPFKKELERYTTGKDTIQLPYNKPVPKTLLRKIALYRLTEVKENNAKWMH